jgi:hypothetical protein
MQRKQLNPGKSSRRSDGAGHGIRNVVELEIQEDAKAQAGQFLNYFGSFGCEELAAYFEESCCAAEPFRQSISWPRAVKIEGNDQ